NNYSMHAITETMARVRARPGSIGLVTALGWYITKHAVGVYSAAPKDGQFAREDPAPHQALLDAAPAPELALGPSGAATIETYTVLYDRDGAPMRGLVVGRLEDGRRFLAGTPDDPDVLRGLVTREAVGLGGRVTTTDGAARFDPA
ncbi:MAG TPA: acetyl-CoA acetyltransferase, partial [Candidatus Binatia bacterium]|nr:acetyl-CoA acetyltransferase [Candidatus Binatia bacterium]